MWHKPLGFISKRAIAQQLDRLPHTATATSNAFESRGFRACQLWPIPQAVDVRRAVLFSSSLVFQNGCVALSLPMEHDERMEARPPANTFQLILFILQCGLLSLACYAVAAMLHQPDWPADWQRIVVATLLACNTATLPPILLTWGTENTRFGVTAALFTTLWRTLTLIAVVILWTATKWLPSEFTAKCLVGCYFPFLILESVHSIRKTNS